MLPTHIKTTADLLALEKFSKRYPNSKKTFIAYKYVQHDRRPPLYVDNNIVYRKGEIISVGRFSTNVFDHCGSGINVATLKWVRDNKYFEGQVNIKLEVAVCDIVCFPKGLRKVSGKEG